MSRAEDSIQESIVSYLRLAVPHLLVFAIPNEAKRSPQLAAAMKRRGMCPGIPDLCLVATGGKSYFLEVKSAKGKLSESQINIMSLMTDRLIPRATVRSISETESVLHEWRLL